MVINAKPNSKVTQITEIDTECVSVAIGAPAKVHFNSGQ